MCKIKKEIRVINSYLNVITKLKVKARSIIYKINININININIQEKRFFNV